MLAEANIKLEISFGRHGHLGLHLCSWNPNDSAVMSFMFVCVCVLCVLFLSILPSDETMSATGLVVKPVLCRLNKIKVDYEPEETKA